ncbi:hypothetical protein [Anaerosinus massiliensis]|uniref:hypothetical protein n=1 Tax=Massilibacillus massiliensis TaxID=1806837 RepID=UPI000DA62713|nr:hypothetical protein [Massilibacillus massiliensis]
MKLLEDKDINLEKLYDWCDTVPQKERIIQCAQLKSEVEISSDVLKTINARLGIALGIINIIIGYVLSEYKWVVACAIILSSIYFFYKLNEMENKLHILRKKGLECIMIMESFNK